MTAMSSSGECLWASRTSCSRPDQRRDHVSLAQHQAERQIEVGRLQIVVGRAFEKSSATEPVEVETESRDTVKLGKFNLTAHDLRQTQIVVAKFARHPRLVVALENRKRSRHIAPLGESLAPPLVVLNNRMELRQVIRDQPNIGQRRSYDIGVKSSAGYRESELLKQTS